MSGSRTQLLALLEPAVESLGYELSDLELHFGGRRGVLRLYIDRLEPGTTGPGGGIGLEDCEAVSHRVSAVLDVEDPIGRDYDLEVSSPGLDRKLVKPAHFDRFAGLAVQGRFRQMLDGRRRFTGRLVGRSGTMVTIDIDGTEVTVPMEHLEVIRLVPEY
jgi:ribosome maturation factor RimP